ncbi:site-specific DNA-methyltransferase [Sphingobacterium puteale]|uniref:site-specific DNA-methyltransferase n=1 Tax=Sphingobacterium puteale TaxID=2420510 RepID=UPI003D981358
MSKKYSGSLTLEWYNKQKAIISLNENAIKSFSDTTSPRINWINKDEALFYELSEKKGVGNIPFWVDRDDIRVKEARPLSFQKAYYSSVDDKASFTSGANEVFTVDEIIDEKETKEIDNILIKGDNLLALNSLKKLFSSKSDSDKVKCIYIDPPYNTGKAFEHYEDNLEASTWLTMIRDRVSILRELLRSDGVLFIQLDEKFIFHLKLLLDDVFGRHNFVNFFTVKTSDPSGFKTVNPSPYDGAEYILMYAKSKSEYKYETIYVPSEHDFGYNQYIKNIDNNYSEWEVIGVNQFIAEREGYENTRAAKKALSEVVFNSLVSDFAIKNAKSIFQGTAIGNDAGSDIIELRNKSKNKTNEFVKLIRENGAIEYAYNGRQVYFYSNKVKNIDGRITPTKQLTNIWLDIPYNGISSEGGVNFSESKKPERLIKRILQIANVMPGDLVMDSFSGSGTTISVAHKMGAKWIGIEIGDHCETLIIPRLLAILKGTDQSGISQESQWAGGGSFKYYHLGESIISIDSETGKGEFNWSLSKKFIQESLLLSYDFIIEDGIKLFPSQLFLRGEDMPTLGKISINSKSLYGVAFLADPKESNLTITNEEIKTIYTSLKKQDDFKGLVIYTNKGIDIVQDNIPEDLDIIKVPHAVFAELER